MILIEAQLQRNLFSDPKIMFFPTQFNSLLYWVHCGCVAGVELT